MEVVWDREEEEEIRRVLTGVLASLRVPLPSEDPLIVKPRTRCGGVVRKLGGVDDVDTIVGSRMTVANMAWAGKCKSAKKRQWSSFWAL